MGLNSQKMNLDYIRTFVVLAQSKNMTEASIKLGVTPSYVSRHISKLEEELKTKLIMSINKFKDMQLTDSGKFFFERYEKIYNDILLTEKDFLQTQKIDNCKISIGICSDLEKIILKPALIKFINEYPNISFKIINGSKEELQKKLIQYSVDFILDKNILSDTSKMLNIKSKKLGQIKYYLIFNKHFYKNIFNIEELPFIVNINNSQEQTLFNEYFSSKNIKLKIKYEVDSLDSIISYVKSGLGVSIVLDNVIDKDLETICLDKLDTSVYISYIVEKLTPATKEFLKILIEQKENF